ncbi:C-type lectin mannose-binding isoform-like [Oculina patagonica]
MKMQLDELQKTVEELKGNKTNVESVCPDNWIPLHGSCYKFSSIALGWNAAKSACGELGSNLVVINSQAEIEAITTKIPEPDTQRTWIGLHRFPNDTSSWMWVDGSPLTYTYWNNQEPNNAAGRDYCVEMYSRQHGWKWNDRPCSAALPYVCETKVSNK